MSKSILEQFTDVDPLINFCTEVQLSILRLTDSTEVSFEEQMELLRVSSYLQKLCNFRMSNILKALKNGKC